MSAMDRSMVFKHRDEVRYRIVDGEAVVIRQEAGEVLGLNDVGARLLDLIDAKTPVEGLMTVIAEEFDVDRSVLERDVLEFLQELVDAGVIEKIGG